MRVSANPISRAFIILCGILALTFGAGCTILEEQAENLPKIESSVDDGATDVSVLDTILVQAVKGSLTSVKLINTASGATVKSDREGNEWFTSEPLGYAQTYELTAEATYLDNTVTLTRTFTTIDPETYTQPWVYPLNNAVVGVAQPVAVIFDEDITDRKAAQECIHIETTPKVEGAFFWVNNKEVRWRGEEFWEPGTTIDVHVNCYGRDLGDGIYGKDNISSSFTIGDRVEGIADDKTHKLVIKKNGEVVKTIPIAMGRDKFPTPHGIYYVGEQRKEMVMDSSTFGLPIDAQDGYRTKVQWATRISYSGIFIHSAPWSLAQQGNSNASHGCLNVSPENGEWVYYNLKPGDPITVKNTKGPKLRGNDGLGDWNIPWEEWKAGNADSHY